jgi:hypothetical protein
VYRLEAASGWIRRAVPPAFTDAFALVMELGGVAVLLVALSVLYWVWDREASATVVGFRSSRPRYGAWWRRSGWRDRWQTRGPFAGRRAW